MSSGRSTAILVMLWAPQGLWGLVTARYGLRFFPVQRRVRFTNEATRSDARRSGGGDRAPLGSQA